LIQPKRQISGTTVCNVNFKKGRFFEILNNLLQQWNVLKELNLGEFESQKGNCQLINKNEYDQFGNENFLLIFVLLLLFLLINFISSLHLTCFQTMKFVKWRLLNSEKWLVGFRHLLIIQPWKILAYNID